MWSGAPAPATPAQAEERLPAASVSFGAVTEAATTGMRRLPGEDGGAIWTARAAVAAEQAAPEYRGTVVVLMAGGSGIELGGAEQGTAGESRCASDAMGTAGIRSAKTKSSRNVSRSAPHAKHVTQCVLFHISCDSTHSVLYTFVRLLGRLAHPSGRGCTKCAVWTTTYVFLRTFRAQIHIK